ncbi:MAG: META domain-containing protein [Microbacterium enclense]
MVTVLAGALFLSGCAAPAASGRWGSEQRDEPYVDLRVGGQLVGYDGCNSFSGTWEDEGDVAVFSEVSTTLVGCLGGPPQWLGSARTAKVDGDRLVFFDDVGVELGALSRP